MCVYVYAYAYFTLYRMIKTKWVRHHSSISSACQNIREKKRNTFRPTTIWFSLSLDMIIYIINIIINIMIIIIEYYHVILSVKYAIYITIDDDSKWFGQGFQSCWLKIPPNSSTSDMRPPLRCLFMFIFAYINRYRTDSVSNDEIHKLLSLIIIIINHRHSVYACVWLRWDHQWLCLCFSHEIFSSIHLIDIRSGGNKEKEL